MTREQTGVDPEEAGVAPPSPMQDIDSAFRATTYRVFVPNGAPIDLRIGERSARLDTLLHDRGCDDWVFITAWNPGARPLGAEGNDARQADLVSALQQRGCVWLAGSGIPADTTWQPEASMLVLGIGRDDAVALGKRFGQLAVVVGTRGREAELAYC